MSRALTADRRRWCAGVAASGIAEVIEPEMTRAFYVQVADDDLG